MAMTFHEALRSRLASYEAQIAAGYQPPKTIDPERIAALKQAQPLMKDAVRSLWLKRHGEPFPYDID